MSGSYATPHFDGSADGSVQTIKASGGQLYAIDAQNPNVTAVYVQIFDHASPVVGTTPPVLSLFVPGSGAMDNCYAVPVEFLNAIKYAVTTTPTGLAGPAAGLILNATFG